MRRGGRAGESLDSIRRECAAYYRAYLRDNRADAARKRQRIIRKLRGMLERKNAPKCKLWLQLADTYLQTPARVRCVRQALSQAPRNAEAHSDLAALCAQQGRRRSCRRHCVLAMAYSCAHEIEEQILETVSSAAKLAGLEEVRKDVLRRANRRFPKSNLFR